MYLPAAFHETELKILHDFIEQHSFGVLVSAAADAPFATHLPLLLDRDSGPQGTLIGHFALVNPQSDHGGGQRVLAIFSGPHAYISPRWYEAEHVVPTWNYVAVRVTGILQRIDDAASLAQIVSRMTDSYERSLPDPWSFDAATTFVERMVSQIVGFRIEIERIEGKWKMSQNHPVERHTKVIAALRGQAHPDSMAVADLMQSRLDQLESPQATT